MEGSNPAENGQQGKIFNLWSRCIAKPSSLLGSSIAQMCSQVDVKNRLASMTLRKMDFMSKCLKRFPEVSLNCHVSASFSLNSAKISEELAPPASNDDETFDRLERCRKIARIEYEIRALERYLERNPSKFAK
ncbi:unnamed protein product [Caenorhabditis brenneri]